MIVYTQKGVVFCGVIPKWYDATMPACMIVISDENTVKSSDFPMECRGGTIRAIRRGRVGFFFATTMKRRGRLDTYLCVSIPAEQLTRLDPLLSDESHIIYRSNLGLYT